MLKVYTDSFRDVEEDVLSDVGLLTLRGKFGYVVVETLDVLYGGVEPSQCVRVHEVQENWAVKVFT